VNCTSEGIRVSENIGGSASPDPVTQNRYVADHHVSHVSSDREWARKRILRRRGLATHAAAYVAVNLFLVVVWLFTGVGYFWPGWVIAGWGVGLVLDAASVLVTGEVTEEQIDRELRNRKP
jgi:hypothetical protein